MKKFSVITFMIVELEMPYPLVPPNISERLTIALTLPSNPIIGAPLHPGSVPIPGNSIFNKRGWFLTHSGSSPVVKPVRTDCLCVEELQIMKIGAPSLYSSDNSAGFTQGMVFTGSRITVISAISETKLSLNSIGVPLLSQRPYMIFHEPSLIDGSPCPTVK